MINKLCQPLNLIQFFEFERSINSLNIFNKFKNRFICKNTFEMNIGK